jgi:hypothetical protein
MDRGGVLRIQLDCALEVVLCVWFRWKRKGRGKIVNRKKEQERKNERKNRKERKKERTGKKERKKERKKEK